MNFQIYRSISDIDKSIMSLKDASLIIVPTPIDDGLPLDLSAKKELSNLTEKDFILAEEPKASRRRWIQWGLPREMISKFVYYNEQTPQTEIKGFIRRIKKGARCYLISDAGLPGIDDPGNELIRRCQEESIIVSATSFPNSHLLALAMSGFSTKEFFCAGFPPQKTADRKQWFSDQIRYPNSMIILDTPYRLKQTITEIIETLKKLHQKKKRKIFIACDLGSESETTYYGNSESIQGNIETLKKHRFVVILSPQMKM